MTAHIQSLERRGSVVFIETGFVILLGLSQLYIAVVAIPRFSALYQDMQMPLPMLTLAVLNYRWVLAGTGCFCSFCAFFIVWRRASMLYLLAVFVLLLAQIALIVVALFLGINTYIGIHSIR